MGSIPTGPTRFPSSENLVLPARRHCPGLAASLRGRAAYEAHLSERARKEAEEGKKLRGRKPKPPPVAEDLEANTSDPESRIMKTKEAAGVS